MRRVSKEDLGHVPETMWQGESARVTNARANEPNADLYENYDECERVVRSIPPGTAPSKMTPRQLSALAAWELYHMH